MNQFTLAIGLKLREEVAAVPGALKRGIVPPCMGMTPTGGSHGNPHPAQELWMARAAPILYLVRWPEPSDMD